MYNLMQASPVNSTCAPADHGAGNVSTHAAQLVGSALGDPYLALSAGLNGLAGPLHGLAMQDMLRWVRELKASAGPDPSKVRQLQPTWRACWHVHGMLLPACTSTRAA